MCSLSTNIIFTNVFLHPAQMSLDDIISFIYLIYLKLPFWGLNHAFNLYYDVLIDLCYIKYKYYLE